ncbi:hypothetical protein BaRGS_00039185, partial [Batillaria attramentaria]
MLCLFLVLVVRLLQSYAATAPCVYVDFPSLNGTDVLETTENTTVQLDFMIRYTCPPAFKEGYLNLTANTTQSTELSFRFRAHSTGSLRCLIIKDVVNSSADNHGSSGNVTGTRHPLSETHKSFGIEPTVFSIHILAIAAGAAFAVGAGMCAVIFFLHRLCQRAPRQDRQRERSDHCRAREAEDKEDELVMIDNVVYNERRALPTPPMEQPYDEIGACTTAQCRDVGQ